jgi:hypothetical protein
MKFITFAEACFFSTFYSVGPFVAYDILRKPFQGSLDLESNAIREMRYGAVISIAFLLFLLYSKSGYRTRYILWHLERPRYASGFSPMETALVAIYHTVVLGLGSELFLSFFLEASRVGGGLWFLILENRIKNIFFLSIVQHSCMELSGFHDKIRNEYFLVERD